VPHSISCGDGWLVYLFLWYPNVLALRFPSRARFHRSLHFCATLLVLGRWMAGLFISLVPECTRSSFSLASAFSSLLLFVCHIPLVVAMDGWCIYFFVTRIYSPLVFPRKRVFIALAICVPYSISCGDTAGLFISLVPEYTRLLFSFESAFSSLLLFVCHIPLVMAMDDWFIYFFGTRIYSPLVFPRKRVFIALAIFGYTTHVVVDWLIYSCYWYPNILVSCFPSQARFYRSLYFCAIFH